MIIKAMQNVGDVLTPKQLFAKLLTLYCGELYPEKKALGSIGGASNGKTIILKNGRYVRVK